MKKIVKFFFMAAFMVSFAACSGGSKESKETPQEGTQQAEVKSDAATTTDVEKALADYEKYVTSFVDVIKKMKSGDTQVITEYSQLSSQLQQFNADMARYQIDFNEDQTKRWEAAQSKLNEALKLLSEKKK